MHILIAIYVFSEHVCHKHTCPDIGKLLAVSTAVQWRVSKGARCEHRFSLLVVSNAARCELYRREAARCELYRSEALCLCLCLCIYIYIYIYGGTASW